MSELRFALWLAVVPAFVPRPFDRLRARNERRAYRGEDLVVRTGVAPMDNDFGQALATGASFGAAGALVLGLLRMLGKAVGWLLERGDSRLREERARLEVWQASLTGREVEYRTKLKSELDELRAAAATKETRLEAIEQDHATLCQMLIDTRGVLLEVTVELHQHAPEHELLAKARAHLERKYPGLHDHYATTGTGLPDAIAARVRQLDD